VGWCSLPLLNFISYFLVLEWAKNKLLFQSNKGGRTVTSVDPLFFVLNWNGKNPLLHFVYAVCFALRAWARSEKDCSCLSIFILAILLPQRSSVAAWFSLHCFCYWIQWLACASLDFLMEYSLVPVVIPHLVSVSPGQKYLVFVAVWSCRWKISVLLPARFNFLCVYQSAGRWWSFTLILVSSVGLGLCQRRFLLSLKPSRSLDFLPTPGVHWAWAPARCLGSLFFSVYSSAPACKEYIPRRFLIFRCLSLPSAFLRSLFVWLKTWHRSYAAWLPIHKLLLWISCECELSLLLSFAAEQVVPSTSSSLFQILDFSCAVSWMLAGDSRCISWVTGSIDLRVHGDFSNAPTRCSVKCLWGYKLFFDLIFIVDLARVFADTDLCFRCGS
jgi:hypothetical protein